MLSKELENLYNFLLLSINNRWFTGNYYIEINKFLFNIYMINCFKIKTKTKMN